MASTSLDAGRTGLRSSSRLPKNRRLSRQRLIRPLFDRDNPDTKTISAGCIRILFGKVAVDAVDHRVPTQTGFAVGRAVGKAVARNRVKRILRDEYQKHQEALAEAFTVDDFVLTLMIVVRRMPEMEGVLRLDLAEALRRMINSISLKDQRKVGSQ